MAVELTTEVPGFTMTGSLLNSYPDIYQYLWQELFAIIAAALTWGHHWQQKKILFYCDNLPIVQAWEGKASKQPRVMSLLRKLFLAAAKNHFMVTMKHLPGKTNNIADALSRK